MPRNFDSPLTIDEHNCITPEGPLELAIGEKPVRLDVWVWQDKGACAAFTKVFNVSNRWKAEPNPDDDHTGAGFEEGPATAMALLVSEMLVDKVLVTKTFHWTEGILLKRDPNKQPIPDHTHPTGSTT